MERSWLPGKKAKERQDSSFQEMYPFCIAAWKGGNEVLVHQYEVHVQVELPCINCRLTFDVAPRHFDAIRGDSRVQAQQYTVDIHLNTVSGVLETMVATVPSTL